MARRSLTGRRPRSGPLAPVLLVALLAGCDDGTAPPTDPVTFTAPIQGVPMVDVFYGAYLDHGTGPGVRDYECGQKSYDGHRGVDVLVRNFAVQDTGVAVIAAAPGVVSVAVDGYPDRNTSWAGGGFGNHVIVDHDGEVRTVYGHLRRNSLTVEPGQSVGAGDLLGLIGSSGNSNWPHLHFEVREAGTVVEPFRGGCGPSRSLWTDQLPYQDEFMVTDAGMAYLPTVSLAVLLERPPDLTQLPLDSDPVRFWFQAANQRVSDVRIEVHGPAGHGPAHTTGGQVGATFSMTFVTTQIPVAGVLTDTGAWEIRLFHDDILTWTQPFTVVDAAAPAASRHGTVSPDFDGSLIQIDQHPPAGRRVP